MLELQICSTNICYVYNTLIKCDIGKHFTHHQPRKMAEFLLLILQTISLNDPQTLCSSYSCPDMTSPKPPKTSAPSSPWNFPQKRLPNLHRTKNPPLSGIKIIFFINFSIPFSTSVTFLTHFLLKLLCIYWFFFLQLVKFIFKVNPCVLFL